MQLFFNLSRVGIDGTSWSKRKFAAIVTSYLETIPGVEFSDLKPDTRWDAYLTLFPVKDDQEALFYRKKIEELCHEVSKKCRPYYFRRRRTDAKLEDLSMFGLTAFEYQRFKDKAPPGVFRSIDV